MAKAMPRASKKALFQLWTRSLRGSRTRPNTQFGYPPGAEEAGRFLPGVWAGRLRIGIKEEPAEASHSGWFALSQLVEWKTGTPTWVHA